MPPVGFAASAGWVDIKLGAETNMPAANARANSAEMRERAKRFRACFLLEESINQPFLKTSGNIHGFLLLPGDIGLMCR